MCDYEKRIKEAGASITAVGLGDRRYAVAFKEETGIPFQLLIDEHRKAYKTVGLKMGPLSHLLRRDNFQARRRAKAAGHRQHRLGKDPLQLGGSFVFGPGNADLFIHVSETFGDNAAPKDLLTALG